MLSGLPLRGVIILLSIHLMQHRLQPSLSLQKDMNYDEWDLLPRWPGHIFPNISVQSRQFRIQSLEIGVGDLFRLAFFGRAGRN
jgi:hypothetical protein